MGRRPIFEKPMTPAERQRRHRAKKQRAAANGADTTKQVFEDFALLDISDFALDLAEFPIPDLAELIEGIKSRKEPT